MDDLISRQAVIDAFTDEIQVTGRANAESVKAYVKLVIDRIKRLPSAQPDYIMNEWCTDCKEYDHEKHCCPRFNKVIRTALQDAQPEIVRCKNCRFYRPMEDEDDLCDYRLMQVFDDDFCSRAERRTDE